MPEKRRLILIVGLFAVLVAVGTLLDPFSGTDKSASPTTYSSAPGGCKALFLLLQELNLPVKRFRWGYQRLRSRNSTLLVINPTRIGFSKREITKLKEWIRRGNRLIIFQGVPSDRSMKKRKKTETEPTRLKWRSATPLSRKFGLKIEKLDSPFPSNASASLPGIGTIGKISVWDKSRWGRAPKSWTTLIKDNKGPIVLQKKMGSGQVVAICDPTIPTNRYLQKDRNLRFVLALLLAQGKPNEILIDEYHHGKALSDSIWKYMGSSVFAWILIQMAIGMALFFYSRRAMNSGRFRSLSRPTGRSSLEYVDSMANIFESCRAGTVALEAILRRFMRPVSSRTGIPIRALESGRAETRRISGAGDPEKLNRLIGRCRNAIDTNQDPGTSLRLARILVSFGTNVSASRLFLRKPQKPTEDRE